LSFFDEADEPRTAPRTRRPSGTGRRPPPDPQAIQVRRAVAAVAILIVIILLVVGIHSCQVSQRNSSLRDYNHNVSSLIQQSDQTGNQFFGEISGGSGASDATGLQNQVNQTRASADAELSRAKSFDVPQEVQSAQQNLLLVMKLRRDGIADVAMNIQAALGQSTSADAVTKIAADMARFYASDVLYKTETAPDIASALHGAGIGVGPNGETIEGGQFLPDLGWLTPDFIRTRFGVAAPASSSAKPSPGPHGHKMDSCNVGGTQLQTGATNTLPATPPPTVTCMFTNTGKSNETNVVVKVSISGTSISGQAIVPQTTPGNQSSAQVKLTSSPPPGTYTLSATVERVPGETSVTRNTLSFPVKFQ
jgi:hypothetical protein